MEKNEWNTLYVTIIDKVPDKNGRQHFDLEWMDNNIGPNLNEIGLRGQCFFGILKTHIDRAKAQGKKVVIL